MFQQGLTSLTSGVASAAITFDEAFAAVPEVILAVVQNTSGDASKSLISAEVDSSSTSGFTVHLSAAPPTANYQLAWIAGSAAAIIQLAGRRLSDFPDLASGILDTDYLLITHTDTSPATMRLRWAVLRAFFPNLKSVIPGSPAASGQAGQIVISPKYIYTHDGTLWGQSARATSSWGSE
jgi:hypothetical protein